MFQVHIKNKSVLQTHGTKQKVADRQTDGLCTKSSQRLTSLL